MPHLITYTEEIEEHGYCQQRPDLRTGDKYLHEVDRKMRLRIVLSVHLDRYVWENVAQWTTVIEEHIKEEGRYYFYNNRCSFKLPMDAETKVLRVEKEGMKHTLMTDDGRMFIIEIRPGMPNFGSYNVQTFNTTVAGYPCLVAKPSIIRQYYINCKKFVVQVDMAPEPDEDFLNSFRLEK